MSEYPHPPSRNPEFHRNKYPPRVQDRVSVCPTSSQIYENRSDECVYRDRMLSSAMHFAIGFFGYPFEGQYQQSITIEHEGVSFTDPFVFPPKICLNSSTTRWHQTRRRSETINPHAKISRRIFQVP